MVVSKRYIHDSLPVAQERWRLAALLLEIGMESHMSQFQLQLMLNFVFLSFFSLSLLGIGGVNADVGEIGSLQLSRRNSGVKALFVFGDSVLDAGTNSFFPSLLQANFKPYGTQYFGKPTGRWTNGRTYADFIALFVGLPFVEPYLKRKGKWSVMQGVNYASAGSGLLRTSNGENRVIPFPDQILQFNQTRIQIQQTLKSETAAFNLFSDSLFLINIGSNDLVAYAFNQAEEFEVYVAGLLKILKDSIDVLYQAGARKMVLVGIGPIGCVPYVLATLNVRTGECVGFVNGMAQAFNPIFEQFVLKLPETFKDLKVVVGKPFSRFLDFVINAKEYGFTAGLTACCGSGLYNAESQCGRPSDLIANPPTNLCDNVEEYIFWDYFHPTDKAYGLMAEKLWDGNSSFVEPYSIRTLISSGNPHLY